MAWGRAQSSDHSSSAKVCRWRCESGPIDRGYIPVEEIAAATNAASSGRRREFCSHGAVAVGEREKPFQASQSRRRRRRD